MPSKITLGLILSALGMTISLAAPLIHIALLSSGAESFLALEVAPGLPLHLLLSIVGVPVALSGLLLFRRGVREELSAEGMVSLDREAVLQRLEEKEVVRAKNVNTLEESKVPSETQSMRRGIKVKSAGLSLICPRCGSENPIGESKCSNCGERFAKSSDPLRACPICGGDLAGAQRMGGDVYVCGVCFSELEIDQQTARRIFV